MVFCSEYLPFRCIYTNIVDNLYIPQAHLSLDLDLCSLLFDGGRCIAFDAAEPSVPVGIDSPVCVGI